MSLLRGWTSALRAPAHYWGVKAIWVDIKITDIIVDDQSMVETAEVAGKTMQEIQDYLGDISNNKKSAKVRFPNGSPSHLSTLRWLYHFFAMASWIISDFNRSSAYIF